MTDQIPGDAPDAIRSTFEIIEKTDVLGDTTNAIFDLVGTTGKVPVHGGRLHIEIIDGGLSVAGEIDAHTCPDLAAALEPLPGSGNVQIDMAGVQFMDSSGLRVLIRKTADERRSIRALCNTRPNSDPILMLG